MSNPAIPVQIGVTDVDSVIDTNSTDLTATGVSTIPTVNGIWTKYTSGVEATLATALADAGYILCKFEFTAGTVTLVRIPCYLTT